MTKKILFIAFFFIVSCNKEVQKENGISVKNNNKISKENSNFNSLNSDNLENLTAISNPNNLFIVTDGKHVELCYKQGDDYKIVQPEGDTSRPKIFVHTKVLGYANFVGPVPVPTRPPGK